MNICGRKRVTSAACCVKPVVLRIIRVIRLNQMTKYVVAMGCNFLSLHSRHRAS